MKQKIELVFFQDDATGDWGVTHKNTHSNYDGFNAFWSGMGIFHDVFEHYFEHNHRYFTGENAMNIGGEMAAMGHMWYYREKLGMYNKRLADGYYSASENMRRTTSDLVEEAIEYGYSSFGNTLECGVPKQAPVNEGELEYQIVKFHKIIKETVPGKEEDCIEYGTRYKKSVSFRKIADLHRWGFKQAERFVPNTWENRDTLVKFMEFWDVFCKNNSAEHLSYYYTGITVQVDKKDDKITWKAVLNPKYGVKPYKITHRFEVEPEDEFSNY